MKFRPSLSVRIWLLAFLNVVLLALVFALFLRLQFRFDVGSFLFAPAGDRIFSVSRLIALQLPNSPQSQWTEVLARYSASYPATFFLFDEDGSQLAGAPVTLPSDISANLHRRHPDEFQRGSTPAGTPQKPDRPRPPFLFARSSNPNRHWIATFVPIWTAQHRGPIHGVLIWQFESLWTNSFFFDYRPFLTAGLAVILVCVVCWLPLIRGLTRSISRMTRATGQIAQGHFEIELPTNRRDELGQLSNSINEMARRLSGFVHGQRRFLSDIAHELCSPIARIQVALGILEQRAEPRSAEYVADVREEVEHMSGLVNELLAFSKAEMNAADGQLENVNLADTVRRVMQREQSAEAHIETQINDGLEVIARPDYLFRSLANVVRNAIRYAGTDGPIVVAAKKLSDAVSITVADQGPGLPENELDNVFKPFYRPEFARQRETGGAGLGLAIVKSCIESCGGAVKCRNRTPKGLEIEILLRAAHS